MNFERFVLDARGEMPVLIVGKNVVSLRALEILTPSTLYLLERLADPEFNNQVVRIDRDEDTGQVRMVKIGVAAHVLHKARTR